MEGGGGRTGSELVVCIHGELIRKHNDLLTHFF